MIKAKCTITLTSKLRRQILESNEIFVDIDLEDFSNNLKVNVLRDIGSIWDANEKITGKEIKDMMYKIADGLVCGAKNIRH